MESSPLSNFFENNLGYAERVHRRTVSLHPNVLLWNSITFNNRAKRMITNQTNLKELSEEAIFDTNLENILLANQLVSEIHKNPNHIILTLTETGVNAIIKAIRLALLEEMRVKESDSSDQESLITKKEVMEKLNISSTTLWIWEKRKYLVPVKIGRRIFYKRQDIEDLTNGK